MTRFNAHALKAQAAALGFTFIGITRAEPSPTLNAYLRWLANGMHGSMGYMARPDRVERRQDLNAILPRVRSLVVVGVDYHTLTIPESTLNAPSRGRIASYAWGLDYHEVLTPRLEQLAQWLIGTTPVLAGSSALSANAADDYRVYVDTGAILERSHAQQAGLGFVGKNTMLIHPRRGSYFFLGEILTTLEFDEYDTPHMPTMCGTCTRCLVACPTNAFPQPYILDARRCISYLTIEHKGSIPPELRPLMGNWVFGCDVCQDVCPWQRFASSTGVTAFYPPDPPLDRVAPSLLDLLALDEATFQQRFAHSPIARIKRERLVRNACVAAGNWGDTAAIPPLEALLRDPSPLIRGHAVWALWQILGHQARAGVSWLLAHEGDAEVRAEIERML